MMRAALYARVSSEEQVEGYSIDAQLRAGRSLAREQGWQVVAEYIDEGKSARSEDITKRPKFREMLKDAQAGCCDVFIVHKLDRFSRNLLVALRSFEELTRSGVTFVSVSEQLDYTTPLGKVFLAMGGAFAQFYSDNLSQETKKGWDERKAQGMYAGLLPFGAMKDSEGIPVPNPETYPGLVMVFDLALEGKTDRQVAQALNAAGYRTAGNQGNRPFTKDTVGGILTNHFFVAELADGTGGWIKAKHKPFIDREKFDTVQELRSSARSPRLTINTRARTYSLSYIARCSRCGGSIRMQTSPRGRARAYCASRAEGLGCDFKGTFLDVYERQIEWYLTTFVIPEDYQRRILDAHSELVKAYDDTKAEEERLKTSLKRLRDQYRWGHTSRQEYLTEYGDIEKRIRQLAPATDRHDELERLAHFLSSVTESWKQAD
jgi:DNA invertase Pin-like site-specific DNA recombinase